MARNEEFDQVGFRMDQVSTALAKRVPPMFAKAEVTNPAVATWVRDFLGGGQVPSLLLLGNVGVGKTFQAIGAVKAIAYGRARLGRGLHWRMTTHANFNAELRPKSDDSHVWALEPYLRAELVLFDDLGAGQSTPWTVDCLHRMVDHRWSYELPSIFSSNLDGRELTLAIGDRLVSRLSDARQVVIGGQDRRGDL